MAGSSFPDDVQPDYRPWQPEALDLSDAQAHQVQLPTAEALEVLHQQAHQEGYETGYREGREAGYQEGRTQVEQDLQQLRAVLTALDQAVQQLGQATSEELLDLALEVARQMLRQALKVKPELLLALVRDAMDSLPQHAAHPHLHLHPDDAALVRAQIQTEITHGGWRIIEDASISRGGCHIETAVAEIDATLASRWQRLAAALGRDASWLDDDGGR
jgi:flagellar assembly protein FliH